MGDKPLYSVRPSYKDKFPPTEVKKIISSFLSEFLSDKSYNPELTSQWTREIADGIKGQIKQQLELPRYKFVVQVVVGEQRGEGVRMGCRCFWDADTDAYADETYRNVRTAPSRAPHLSSCTRLMADQRTCLLCLHIPSACRIRCFALRPCSPPTCTSALPALLVWRRRAPRTTVGAAPLRQTA